MSKAKLIERLNDPYSDKWVYELDPPLLYQAPFAKEPTGLRYVIASSVFARDTGMNECLVFPAAKDEHGAWDITDWCEIGGRRGTLVHANGLLACAGIDAVEEDGVVYGLSDIDA